MKLVKTQVCILAREVIFAQLINQIEERHLNQIWRKVWDEVLIKVDPKKVIL